MKTKTILTMAIIAALPCVAMATDPIIGPDHENISNSIVRATYEGPYKTANKTSADESHIATTAYVKGAYNDVIAAVNKLDYYKMSQVNVYDESTGKDVLMANYALSSLDDLDGGLITEWVTGMAVKNAIDSVDNKIDNKRVEIYTTWDNDNAKTQVAFVNAPAQQ